MSNERQAVIDSKGKIVAMQIPITQYNKMIERIEELEDVKAYKKAKQNKSEWIPFDEAFAMFEKKKK